METEEAQILRAIRAQPSDDTPRLVYADWLEENGRAERAEFIRLQCAWSSAADNDPRRPRFKRRERQLLQKFEKLWLAEIPSVLRRFPFQRGFVQPSDLELTAWQFLAIADVDVAPQWSVKLFIHPSDPVARLSESEHLERLTGLSLCAIEADDGVLEDLLGSPRLRNLRSLNIEGQPFGADHVRVVANSPALAGLRHLGVFCSNIHAAGAEAIAASPYLRNLESLNLNGCGIGDAGLDCLAASRGLDRLRELNLRQNRLDNAAASAIIGSRHLKGLTALGLFGNHLGDAGARALALGRNLERLARLDLGLNRIGPTGARALASSPFLFGLRQLYLRGNRVSDDPIAIDALRTRFGGRLTV
jgi:uncharacterized protein (TIGR02996 family)